MLQCLDYGDKSVKLDPAISMSCHITGLVQSCNYHIRALRHVANAGIYKDGCLSAVAACLDYCNSLLYGTSTRPVIISGNCRWHRMHWLELYKLLEHAVPWNCAIYYIGYQWSNASTTSSQFWLTRRGRVEVHHIWHVSLVTTCHLIHWDCPTNCCLAILIRPSSWLTKHFLLALQIFGTTRLLTAVQLYNPKRFFLSHMPITPSNSAFTLATCGHTSWATSCRTCGQCERTRTQVAELVAQLVSESFHTGTCVATSLRGA